MTGRSTPDRRTIHSALAVAGRAPSLHNTQPWRWEVDAHSVRLHADRSRQLPATDPAGRQLVISCGAALHHARVAFAALGWRVTAHRLPRPDQPDHLATLEFVRHPEIDPDEVALALAASRRHTDRRPFLPDAVPRPVLDRLTSAAAEQGARWVVVDQPTARRELVVAIGHADATQRADPAYRTELAAWAGRSGVADEGVPAANLPDRRPGDRGMPARDFQQAGLGSLAAPHAVDDGAALGVLATDGDDQGSWLAAGESLSAVLLAATDSGLATCPLSQVPEVEPARDLVRTAALGGSGQPQIVLRLGWPAGDPLGIPATARRPLAETVSVPPPW
ncbi:Acg family FMN-binding oxidoreductase [Streptoalloteichus hindustanus]|uniref:Nitroreductase n=1 Tax=Streptoalloteichus hindustanus TaxID=2017 RepID=A0A1M5DTQ7_STRHI|nr:nitroreductase family protein [Streptoalloteichus hindustanus]SHF70330.1 Nitroreductase [Streptoalloteichus hindustanus]